MGHDATTRTSIQAQIYDRLKGQVIDGTLAPGQRVPSLRALASELGIARGTAEAAYDRLIGEGWLVPRGPAGTFVAELAWAEPAARASAVPSARESAPVHSPGLLRLGLPALDVFPRKLWARLVARHVRAAGPSIAPTRPVIRCCVRRSRHTSGAPAG